MSETCWTVSVRQSNKFYDWLLHLVGCFIWVIEDAPNHKPQIKKMFGSSMINIYLGLRGEELTGGWGRLYKVEFYDLNCSPNIIRVIKYRRRIKWTGHVARMGHRRGTYTVVVGRYEGNKTLGKPRRRWEQILKLIFKKWDRGHGLGSSGSVG